MPDWETEARPVLAAVYELVVNRREDATSQSVSLLLGTDVQRTGSILSYLADDAYFEVEYGFDQTSGEISTEVRGLKARTLHVLAGWPPPGSRPDASAQLLQAIDELMATATPEERTRLTKLRDATVGVGTNVLTQVLAKLATQGL